MSGAIAKRLDEISNKTAVKDREVAQLLGTTPQTISRWKNDLSEPQSEHLKRILDLSYVAEELSEFYEPEEARLWLFQRHRLLGGRRPVDLIGDGEIEAVLRLIAQLRDGAYV